MKRWYLLSILSILLSFLFLILYFLIPGFPLLIFFFIPPMICWCMQGRETKPPHEVHPAYSIPRYCPQCGKQLLEPFETYCPRCGTQISEES